MLSLYFQKLFFLRLLCFIIILLSVVGEDVEYYPSRSLLKNKIAQNRSNNSRTDLKFVKNNNKLTRVLNEEESKNLSKTKREVDPIFYGHPKTREELWEAHFLNKSTAFDQTPSLINLLHNLTLTYLNDCTPLILYDKYVEYKEGHLLQNLFKIFPTTFLHGRINDNDNIAESRLLVPLEQCLHYIVFLADVKRVANVIGLQATSKVIVVARSSQWAVQEFLSEKHSRSFVNLLVIGQTFKDDDVTLEAPYILYTHKLYIDGLGSSKPVVLTSWTHGKYSRNVNLFPSKMIQGYAGHRFTIAAAHQPPFVFRRIITDSDGGNPRVVWDGVEMRVLKLLAERNNFSIEIIEPKELILGPGDAVAKEISSGRADIGVAGMYLTKERLEGMDMSFSHSQDCAVFITLMSTALPRYRAILGPFHWHVWVALTFTYLIAIFPIAFSDKHTLRHLLHNGGEVENMFWYVFGTFTNCFTFVGKNSWSRTTKITTRLLIGWYWIFTIIITSCYTGSIIAFVTLPIFPETVDSIDQLLKGFYRVGTLDKGGWEHWFFNSSDPKTNKLLRKVELLPDVLSGIKNTTKAFFWPYAYLGSKSELEYIVQLNFSRTSKSKRAVLHISDECFVPFGISMAFPNQSLYTTKFNGDIGRMLQGGLLDKLTDEVRWEMQRTSTGRLLAVNSGGLKAFSPEEKGLTLDDTQGMFLLLAIGFLIAAGALISEWMGSCSRFCSLLKSKKLFSNKTSSRNTLIATPISKVTTEIQVVEDQNFDTDSRIFFGSRNSSTSKDTLDGETIDVTEESIIVHDNLDANEWGSRRSSSVELDREVQEIFERDMKRLRGHSVSVVDIEEASETEAFGEHVNDKAND